MELGITVHLDEVGVLAAQLSALAAELSDGALTCRSAAVRLRAALGEDEGRHAGALATAWASLADVVAERAGAMATTLVSATVAYRIADADLAGGLAIPAPRWPA